MTQPLARIREDIELTSPDGDVFTALWAGNNRKKTKKLGLFGYPAVPGEFIQDLDVGADSYPITIFFDGPNNDKEAKKFFLACGQNGTWSVKHPMHGELDLQLVDVTEKDQPIQSSNITPSRGARIPKP